jgi:hypothetical protein
MPVGLMRTGPARSSTRARRGSLVVRSLRDQLGRDHHPGRGLAGRYAERTGQRRGQALAELESIFPPRLEATGHRSRHRLDTRSIGIISCSGFFPRHHVRAVLRQGAPLRPRWCGRAWAFAATAVRLIYEPISGPSRAHRSTRPPWRAAGQSRPGDHAIVNQRIWSTYRPPTPAQESGRLHGAD